MPRKVGHDWGHELPQKAAGGADKDNWEHCEEVHVPGRSRVGHTSDLAEMAESTKDTCCVF